MVELRALMRAVSRAASKADKMVAARVLQWVAWKVALRAVGKAE